VVFVSGGEGRGDAQGSFQVPGALNARDEKKARIAYPFPTMSLMSTRYIRRPLPLAARPVTAREFAGPITSIA
jgi:hypothetical protein